MQEAFDEAFVADGLDPLDGALQTFDWDMLIALAWVLNPAYFEGSPSLRDLARRCGIQPSTLARHTGHYSRFISWRNRGQRHAWNWQAEEVPGTTRSESFAEPGEHDAAGSPTTDQPAEPEEAAASVTVEKPTPCHEPEPCLP